MLGIISKLAFFEVSLFCCKLVFAITYALLGGTFYWKTCLGKKKTFSIYAVPVRSVGDQSPVVV